MSTLFPVNIPFVDVRTGLISRQWLPVLQQLQSLTPTGSGFVADGSATSYGPMTLFQGLDINKGTATPGAIYFALDTGKTYFYSGGTWAEYFPDLSGDVTNVGTTVLLNNVFPSPGTYGGGSLTPILTIDSKGRVTSLALETVTATVVPQGPNGALQFNDAGTTEGTSQIFYNQGTGALTFSNPLPTFNNLSPLIVAGDLLTHNGTNNIRLPVGTEGQALRVESGVPTWVDANTLETRFNFGDATPKPLGEVPANRVVRSISIVILTAFTDAASTLAIPGLMATTDNLPFNEGTYQIYPGVEFGLNTAIELVISAATSTQGSGLVTISLED